MPINFSELFLSDPSDVVINLHFICFIPQLRNNSNGSLLKVLLSFTGTCTMEYNIKIINFLFTTSLRHYNFHITENTEKGKTKSMKRQ